MNFDNATMKNLSYGEKYKVPDKCLSQDINRN